MVHTFERRLSKDRIINDSFNLILLTPLLVSLFFFFIPLFFVLIDAVLSDSGYITFEFIQEALINPLNLYFIRFTINQAIISSIITVIIGLPGAYIFAKYQFPGDRVLKTILTVPFVLPPIVVVLGFVLLLGPNGILNSVLMSVFQLKNPPIQLYKTFEGIILVHAFYNVPIVLHLVSSAWKKANVDMEEVATTLGSRNFHLFRYVTFPQISSAILASGILTFLYCFTSFAVVLSLGGIQYKTLEVQIYSLFHYRYDYHQAAALALFQLLITSVLIILYLYFSEPVFKRERFPAFLPLILKRFIQFLVIGGIVLLLLYFRVEILLILLLGLIGAGFWKFGRTTPLTIGEIRERSKRRLIDLFILDKIRFSMVIIYITSLTIFLLSPILIIFISAFYDRMTNSWNIEAFFNLLGLKVNEKGLIWAPESIPALGASTTAINLIFNSLVFALVTLILSAFFGILSIYMIRRSDFLGRHPVMGLILSWSLVLPLVTSSITIGLGMLRAFGFIRISSQDAWIPIILAHLIAAYPFVSRSVSTAYNKIDYGLIEMGKTLGASRWHIFRDIEFPIISSGILAGATFALAISFGEFGATYFIARSEFTTMTIGIYKFLNLRQLQNSSIMASILILVCVFAFLLVQKLGEDEFHF
ncbi:MAG: iron ABC transporter permease [Candidatus Heimdallarchaeota archaeon]|nr:MAG: iron ABC transporter permease [Candidatus Heimdallarchaeota archaeon]